MSQPTSMSTSETEGLPPFVTTWSQLYTIVIVTLVIMIVLFYAFMIHFQ